MSAVPMPRRWHSPWPVLRDCVPAWVRWFVLFFGALMSGFAAIAGATNGAALATVMCVLVVAMAWMLWFYNLLYLHLEARQSRTPTLARTVGMAVAGAWLGTVALPSVLLAWAGQEFSVVLPLLTVVAAGGLLMFLLPRAVLVSLCLLPMLGMGLAHIVDLPEPPQWQAAYWPWLAVGMVLLAAWCWRFNLRWGNSNGSAWWQPLGLARLQAVKTTHGQLAGYSEPWRFWAWAQGGRIDADPATPERAMRSLIGGTYAPVTYRHLLVNAVIWIVLGVFVMQLDHSFLRTGLLAGFIASFGIAPTVYGQQLEMLFSRQARELDELALLPGWGDVRTTRATLLRALAWPPLRMWAVQFMLVLVLLAVLHVALPPANVGLLVLMCILSMLLPAVACLRPMAGLSITGWKGWAILLPSLILLLLGAFHVAFEGEATRYCALLLGALLLVCIVYALLLRATWRRFLRRPHPFLMG